MIRRLGSALVVDAVAAVAYHALVLGVRIFQARHGIRRHPAAAEPLVRSLGDGSLF